MVHDVPHELQIRIEGIQAAQFLKEFKLYEEILEDDLAMHYIYIYIDVFFSQ